MECKRYILENFIKGTNEAGYITTFGITTIGHDWYASTKINKAVFHYICKETSAFKRKNKL